MNLRGTSILLGFSLLSSLHPGGAAPVTNAIFALPDHLDGMYMEGERITWKVSVKPREANPVTKVSYVIKKNGAVEAAKGEICLTNNQATLTFQPESYGTDRVEFRAGDSTNDVEGFCGVAVSPEKITPGTPCPENFDAFWKAKIKRLQSIPANPALTPAPGGKTGVEYFKITLDNIDGTHVYGQLARPVAGAKFPAVLQFQHAGVYPLQKAWVTDRAAKGWLAMNIIAHDIPIDEKPEFYENLKTNALTGYTHIGETNRETSYFLRMLLSCYRAADYLAARPDWDGRVFVVTGGSQGGFQSFWTGAFFPKVTAVIVEVPAGCNTVPGRDQPVGWPGWARSKDPKVLQTARYYDAASFAARITCPVLVGVGLADSTSPAWGVFSAFNQVKGPKEIIPLPAAEHTRPPEAFKAFKDRSNDWFNSLVKGEQPPLAWRQSSN
ncbi:MAG: acetylxylan esterase [Verrucomicrobiota bacterium]